MLLLATLASPVGGAATTGELSGAVQMSAVYALALARPWSVLRLALPCGHALAGATCGLGRWQPLGSRWPATPSDALPRELTLDAEHAPAASLEQSLRADAVEATEHAALREVPRGASGTLGGFMNVDVMSLRQLSAGPLVSWLTPDSPREDLLRLRVFASGWGVRYTVGGTDISLGVAASTRFLVLGEDFPVIDVVTSEARLELPIP